MLNLMDFVTTRNVRQKRDLRNHNIFYDALHYVFGLDNGAYDQIEDLEENQDKIVEELASQGNQLVLAQRNMNTRLENLTEAYDTNFKNIADKISNMESKEDVLALLSLSSEILMETEKKYRQMLSGAEVVLSSSFGNQSLINTILDGTRML